MSRKILITTLLASLFVGWTCQAALAENKPHSFFLTPFVGGYVFEGNQSQEHGPQVGVGLGYNFTEHWAAEGVFRYIDSEGDDSPLGGNVIAPPGADVDIYMVHFDVLYNFQPQRALVPYLAAGLGALSTEVDGQDHDDEDYLVNWGGGVKYFFRDNLALRLDLRHVLDIHARDDHNDDVSHNFSYTAGLSIFFGGDEPPPPAKAEPAPAPVKMEEKPAPPPMKVEEKPAPPPMKVEEKPAPPPMPESFRVVVEFDFDESFIRKEYEDDLAEVADIMKRHPDYRAKIEGHTDSIGTASYNVGLSKRRAMSVRDHLVKNHGLSENRFDIEFYGETRPIATNETPEGRQRNRRAIVISIVPM